MAPTDWSPFTKRFTPDNGARGPFPSWSAKDTTNALRSDVPAFTDFLRTSARTSYGRGLLRFLAPDALASWNGSDGWNASWPQWRGRLFVFAMDWSGRQMAFDLARREKGEPPVSMLDVATGELFETPATFESFVRTELVEYPEETMTASAHAAWLRSGGAAPSEEQCVGHRESLFLGGEDAIENMELTDTDVLVSLCGQLAESVADVPDGEHVAGVKITD